MITIERQDDCWRKVCRGIKKCVLDSICCGHLGKANTQFLNSSCPLLKPEDVQEHDFDFGIFLDALHSRVAEKRNFWSKLSYCFWWGLRNLRSVVLLSVFSLILTNHLITFSQLNRFFCLMYLSSLGQDLKTSNSVWEILFAVFICIVGLILFSLLIGNMQVRITILTFKS